MHVAVVCVHYSIYKNISTHIYVVCVHYSIYKNISTHIYSTYIFINVIYACVCYGNGFGVCVSLCVRFFLNEKKKKKWRGKIVGVTMGVFALAPMFFSTIWDNQFVTDSEDTTRDSQRVASYFWFLAAFIGISAALGIVSVRKWDADDYSAEGVDEYEEDNLEEEARGLL